jgi:hypothetical protein
MRKNKNILNFEDFVSESLAEFGFGGFGYDAGAKQAQDMSMNAGSEGIRQTNHANQNSRLQNILNNVFAGITDVQKNQFNIEISDLTIVRIFPNNNNSVDVYIKFKLGSDGLYYGTFRNWGSYSGAKFDSPVLNHPQFKHHLENSIKLEGMFKQCLNEWFMPKEGEYRALKQIKVYDDSGNIFMLPLNGKIEVESVLLEEDKPIVYLQYSDRRYYLTELDYYFFHWWFEPKEKTKFYI